MSEEIAFNELLRSVYGLNLNSSKTESKTKPIEFCSNTITHR